jgi:hypothetical protein
MKAPRKCLPELFDFIDSLANQIDIGALKNWDEFSPQVRDFFTPAQMKKVEKFVVGWARMASYADGITLIHVASALVGLVQLPEYKSASPVEQQIMEWIILFHDIGKQIPPNGGRDAAHAFRSAILTARGLQSNGFIQVDEDRLFEWCTLTQSAIKADERSGQEVQNNSCFSLICAGIENLFGQNSPASLIIKSVLFHLSITVVTDWPQATPLDDRSISKYIDAELFPYLKVMMLVDSEAWSLFDLDTKMRYRQETLEVFERISKLVGG